eukprot:3505390-Amphidinium_carterae.1
MAFFEYAGSGARNCALATPMNSDQPMQPEPSDMHLLLDKLQPPLTRPPHPPSTVRHLSNASKTQRDTHHSKETKALLAYRGASQ